MRIETISPTVEQTQDGSPTLRHPLLGDTYHSDRGAVGEARHVFIEAGLRWRLGLDESVNSPIQTTAVAAAELHSPRDAVRILEVGFGSGLNAYLTAQATLEWGARVSYQALELYPISMETVAQLSYAADPLFVALHSAPWGEEVAINEHFTLFKRPESLLECSFTAPVDLIYFDAFAPQTQPELWTEAVFRHLWNHLTPGGGLVTYSAKGEVKEHLRAAGFEVKRLPGALGKRHMVRAVKPVWETL